MKKDINDQPDKEVHRVGSRGIMNEGASPSMEWGGTTLLVWVCVWQFGSSLKPTVQRFMWNFHYCAITD